MPPTAHVEHVAPRVNFYNAPGKQCSQSTCGLVAMTSASHDEGRQFDPGQVYVEPAPTNTLVARMAWGFMHTVRRKYTPGQDRTGDIQRVGLAS